MHEKTSLIITSINPTNRIVQLYANLCKDHHIDFVLIGDIGIAEDRTAEGSHYWSIDRQKSLRFRLPGLLPTRHYSRKNLGYLLAKERGMEVIIETDDDNLPNSLFWNQRSKLQTGGAIERSGWINVYRYFTKAQVWPRGFPLQYVKHPDTVPAIGAVKDLCCPIQQGLVDENPDVDAIYRLVQPLPLNFSPGTQVILGKNTWCPFNSQNTTWFSEAFPLLYLPSYCSFRMTDIWRSFVAQRICWENNWHILFHSSTVRQERNEHDLMKDFAAEIPGYMNNASICKFLEKLDLKAGTENIPDNMLKCYKALVAENFIDSKELPLLDSWLFDIQ